MRVDELRLLTDAAKRTRFDFVLRDDPALFSVRIIDRLMSETGADLQEVLKPLEKDRVRSRHPRYNRVYFTQCE